MTGRGGEGERARGREGERARGREGERGQGRGRLVAWFSVTCGAVVVGACALVLYHRVLLELQHIGDLERGSEVQRLTAARWLADRSSVKAIPQRLKTFAATFEEARPAYAYSQALLGIVESAEESAVAPLVDGLETETAHVPRLSAELLMTLGPKAKAALPVLRKKRLEAGDIFECALRSIDTGEPPDE